MPTTLTACEIGVTLTGSTNKNKVAVKVRNRTTGDSSTVLTDTKGKVSLNIGIGNTYFTSGVSDNDVIEVSVAGADSFGYGTLKIAKDKKSYTLSISCTDVTSSTTPSVTI